MRLAYCVRIQSSLNRLGTFRVTTAPDAPWSLKSAAGSGLIQVLNCCSGNSAAKRSQPRSQRSALMLWKSLPSRVRILRRKGDNFRVIHRLIATGNTPLVQTTGAKSLTNQEVFGVIVGFPDRSLRCQVNRETQKQPNPFNQASQSTAAECRIPQYVWGCMVGIFIDLFLQFQDRP